MAGRSFIPFEAMTDAQQVEHLVVAHALDAEYFDDGRDPRAYFAGLTARERVAYWHDADHVEDPEVLGDRLRHDHDKEVR